MRFHVGFSFRLKYLKKFLFPILIGILAYFGFGLFGIIQTYAYVNTDTYYVFDIPEEDFSQQFYLDKTYKDILDYYSNFESDYYNIIVWYNYQRNDIYLNLYPKNYELVKSVGSSGSTLDINGNNTSVSKAYNVTLFKKDTINFTESYIYDIINNCLSSNTCQDSYNSSYGQFNKSSTNQGVNKTLISFDTISNLSNDMSYNLENVSIRSYPYYSQLSFTLSYSNISNSYYTKYLYINNNVYGNGSLFPTYLDLHNENTLVKDFNSIDRIYVGSIPKNNINSFSIDLKFTYNDINYLESLNPHVLYFGRINNNSYYSYDLLSCSSSNLWTYTTNNSNVSSKIFNNGFSCIDDLTNYDNIYLYIQMRGIGDSLVNNISLSSNYGNIISFNNTLYDFQIYEQFTNLSYDESIVLSSLSYQSIVYMISTSINTILSPINKDNAINNSGSYNPLKYGQYNSTNALIYNIPNNGTENYNIDLFFTYDSILSISNTNDFYYYDDSNQIHNGNVTINNVVNYNDSYNVSYYFLQVSNFIESLSLSTQSFSRVVQSIYDSFPLILQSFIFILFIISCCYFTYLLIRK